MNTEQNTVPENKTINQPLIELLITLTFAVAVYIFALKNDLLEEVVKFTRQHENWELDEVITVSMFMLFALALFSVKRWKEARNANNALLQQNKDLQKALSEIKQLRGIIPICGTCKQVRDDEGYWHQVEMYIHDHSEAEFSHGICPECIKKEYPGFLKNEEKDTNLPALDGVRYPLGCPRCNHRFKLPIRRLGEGCSIGCPKCGASLIISNYHRSLIRKKVEQAVIYQDVIAALG